MGGRNYLTTKTIHYDNEADMKIGVKAEIQNGFRAIHHDFTNNDKRQGYEIFFDDTPLGPDPNQPKIDRLEVLEAKILDDTITERELVEYERLKIQSGR